MNNNLPEAIENDLTLNDPPKMIWIRVKDAIDLLWDRNPKEHDLGAIAKSIEISGFQELPKYDATLGGIKAGNGRIEALAAMERNNVELPRGLAKNSKQEWVMPLLIGVDAESLELAYLYAIDSNNTSLQGGSLTALDASTMYDAERYLEIISELVDANALPVSIDEEDATLLLEKLSSEDEEVDEEEAGEENNKNVLKFSLSDEEFDRWLNLKDAMKIKNDKNLFLHLLNA